MSTFLRKQPVEARAPLNEFETELFFGIVFKGTIRDFEALKEYLTHYTSAKLLYQHKDLSYLKIFRADSSEAKEHDEL